MLFSSFKLSSGSLQVFQDQQITLRLWILTPPPRHHFLHMNAYTHDKCSYFINIMITCSVNGTQKSRQNTEHVRTQDLPRSITEFCYCVPLLRAKTSYPQPGGASQQGIGIILDDRTRKSPCRSCFLHSDRLTLCAVFNFAPQLQHSCDRHIYYLPHSASFSATPRAYHIQDNTSFTSRYTRLNFLHNIQNRQLVAEPRICAFARKV